MLNHLSPQDLLAQGLQALKLSLSSSQQSLLFEHLKLLQVWNKVYNLTSITDIKMMVIRHVLDSLAILPYVQALRLVDVGSGGGFPGIPLAIAMPDQPITLLEAKSKKIQFLQYVCRELKLDKVSVVHSRAEHYQPKVPFDGILIRAVGPLACVWLQVKHLKHPQGYGLAMLGRTVVEPEPPYTVAQRLTLSVPGLQERQLWWLH